MKRKLLYNYCPRYDLPVNTRLLHEQHQRVKKVQVHLQKLAYREKVHFLIVTLKKVKLSYILDSLHVK